MSVAVLGKYCVEDAAQSGANKRRGVVRRLFLRPVPFGTTAACASICRVKSAGRLPYNERQATGPGVHHVFCWFLAAGAVLASGVSCNQRRSHWPWHRIADFKINTVELALRQCLGQMSVRLKRPATGKISPSRVLGLEKKHPVRLSLLNGPAWIRAILVCFRMVIRQNAAGNQLQTTGKRCRGLA